MRAGLKIQMPQPLMDGSIEYEDGTEATMSQMAKDVTVFLAWAAEPELDGRITYLVAREWPATTKQNSDSEIRMHDEKPICFPIP